MAKMPLVIYPDAILKTRCSDILTIDQALVDLVRDMSETMYASNGIGLAAPQVAKNIRLMILDVEPERGGEARMHFINPVIVESHGKTSYEEGCLSFPGLSAEVRRKDQVHIKAYDVQGHEIDLEADGLLSICIQHELDHLNGITFVDRLSPVDRKLLLRDYLRERQEERREQRQRAEDERLAALTRAS